MSHAVRETNSMRQPRGKGKEDAGKPKEKKGRLREQLRRPTFKRLELDKKVRFLSYEAVDEIDQFFSTSAAGLNVDVILAKSEQAA